MLTKPPVKKIDLHFPLGMEVTARNLKGVTIKDAMDAIYKAYKKRVSLFFLHWNNAPILYWVTLEAAADIALSRLMTSSRALTSLGSSGTRRSHGRGSSFISKRRPAREAAVAAVARRRRRTRTKSK